MTLLHIKKTIFPILVLAGISTLAFYGTLFNDFVFYDDINYVKENPFVLSGITWPSFVWAWTSLDHTLWHPITWISFMLDTEMYGTGPFGYHLTNLILHSLNAALLFYFLKSATKKTGLSFFVALFFAIHPLRVESVAWISERKDVLSFFFLMLAFIVYVKNVATQKGRAWWGAVYLFFALGAMSKIMLVSFPLLLLIIDYWPLERHKLQNHNWASLIKEKSLLIFLSIVFCIFNLWAYKVTGLLESLPSAISSDRFLNALFNYGLYLKKMLWPMQLTVYEYYRPLSALQVILAITLFCSVTGVAIWQIKKRPYILAGWLWYLISLGPVVGFVKFTMTRAGDRFTYIPCIGILVMIVWGFQDYFKKWPEFKKVVLTFAATLVLFYIFLTQLQIQTWKNSKELYKQALRVYPDEIVIFNNAGINVALEGRAQDALDHFHAIIEIKPDFLPAYYNIAKIYEEHGTEEQKNKAYKKIQKIESELGETVLT